MNIRALRWGAASFSAGLLATVAVASSATTGTASITPVVKCASLTGLGLPNTQILSAAEVTTPVPHCAVIGIINKRVSAQDPDHDTYGIGFQVNLPDSWAGRFEMQGGAASDGSVGNPTGSAGFELSDGWAVATDDGGHEDAPGNPLLGGYIDDDNNAGGAQHFGVDEQARIDYGYNGIAQTTAVSKAIIAAYYGQRPAFSYLWGCSNGGRDGIVAAQRIPDEFDGIVSGNPGFDLPRASVTEAWNEQALAPLSTHLDSNGVPFVGDTFGPESQDFEVASAAILQACDALDGLVDGIIDNYTACTTDRVNEAFRHFTCASPAEEHSGTCLTTAQIAALNKIMAGPRTSAGLPLYSPWFWDAGIWDPPTAPGFGFAAWNVAFIGPPGVNSAANLTLGAGAAPMIFTTPPVVLPVTNPRPSGNSADSLEGFMFNYNFDEALRNIFGTAPGYSQSAMDFMTGTPLGPSPDLSAFKRHRGKMIIYDSINDGIFSGVDIIDYYKLVNIFSGGAPDFARLFLIPNMAHCGGGPATSSFNDSLFTAITEWAESGVAPSQIIAANTNKTSPFPSGGLFDPRVAINFPTNGTRPICPYPQQTRYKGTGSTASAANFTCVNPNPFEFDFPH
jgi:feruloyl esterase